MSDLKQLSDIAALLGEAELPLKQIADILEGDNLDNQHFPDIRTIINERLRNMGEELISRFYDFTRVMVNNVGGTVGGVIHILRDHRQIGREYRWSEHYFHDDETEFKEKSDYEITFDTWGKYKKSKSKKLNWCKGCYKGVIEHEKELLKNSLLED